MRGAPGWSCGHTRDVICRSHTGPPPRSVEANVVNIWPRPVLKLHNGPTQTRRTHCRFARVELDVLLFLQSSTYIFIIFFIIIQPFGFPFPLPAHPSLMSHMLQ